ncbi:pilus assembly protein TadG-related protein [Pyxidicoccus xibeiensis]|uniref:pilus assembly protein TadG-related protein n=1 Tax=Pyxidicoccus xibeiensis TaxID=2906759 RepID=UPI0020A80F29|nr:pilus assembly protein TadG-related protein [Pyxidicoccus xibeiensis]MCP3137496.1 hypothetical protein [Pyxidicoccus xibeiensis]
MRLPLPLRLSDSRWRRARGQTLTLAALSLLLLALMVALTFNLGHALRGKVRLQHHVDAQAYSMAIVEARALNYFAVSNRAIAATYVTMNSLHAHMAAASATEAMLRAGAANFRDIAVMEGALCGGEPSHCRDLADATKISLDFADAADRYKRKLQGMDADFRKAVTRLDAMLDSLRKSQSGVFHQTQKVLLAKGDRGLEALYEVNSPSRGDRALGVARAQPLPEFVGALNGSTFACALDGNRCQGRQDAEPATHAKVMTEVANATRPRWTASRMDPSHLNDRFLQELTRSLQKNEGSTQVLEHQGTAKTVESLGALHGRGRADGNTGLISAADEHGRLVSRWRDGFATNAYSSRVASNAVGGLHSHGHRGLRVHFFEGVFSRELKSCTQEVRGNCFMQFRPVPDAREDFGQPSVFAYARQQLRADRPDQAPWQLNEHGRLEVEHGRQGTAELRLAPGEGAAMSRALVYYHRLGDWREPPNLFNPYWRAKLHPMTPEQAAQVLRAAGHHEALPLAEDLAR